MRLAQVVRNLAVGRPEFAGQLRRFAADPASYRAGLDVLWERFFWRNFREAYGWVSRGEAASIP